MRFFGDFCVCGHVTIQNLWQYFQMELFSYSAFYKVKFWCFVALTTSGSFWLKQSLSTVNSSVQKFNRLLIWKKVLIQICPHWSTIGNCYHWFINVEVRETAGGGGRGRKQEYDVRLNLTAWEGWKCYFRDNIFQNLPGEYTPGPPLEARARAWTVSLN